VLPISFIDVNATQLIKLVLFVYLNRSDSFQASFQYSSLGRLSKGVDGYRALRLCFNAAHALELQHHEYPKYFRKTATHIEIKAHTINLHLLN
jgi:hypothetical protein